MPAPEPVTRSRVGLAVGCAAVLVAQHVASRACRDALFLSHFPAAELPKVMLAAAAVGLLLVLAVARAMARFGPRLVIPGLVALSGGVHALEWKLLGQAPETAVVLLYI